MEYSFMVRSVMMMSWCFNIPTVTSKWVEGHLQTSQNWAFLARFCFLSYDGQFEYQIEFSREMGLPNLLLYYDDDSQWPSVYHSNKTCREREAVLNKAGQNQIIPLSHWYPESEYSGCVLKTVDPDKNKNSTQKGTKVKKVNTTTRPIQLYPRDPNATTQDPRYYDQFLKTSATPPISWVNASTTEGRMDVEMLDWSATAANYTETPVMEKDVVDLEDVEEMFSTNEKETGSQIIRRRRQYPSNKKFNAAPPRPGGDVSGVSASRLSVSCRTARRFKSARARWWFVAISSCGDTKGLDVKYKFLMTNGPPGDYWHEHFSADEFYVLPILMAFCLAYALTLLAVVVCSVELRARQLLHATYKLFLMSAALQQGGILLQSLAYSKYAVNGMQSYQTDTMGRLLCGLSEITYLLLLVLMAKGYTITRARLKVGFTIKLTVFICFYFTTYISLFVYQAEEFDPGEVLYLYESPAGYGLLILRICAWFMFIYAIIFTIRKYPEKAIFYYPFSMCGTLWFYAGPLFILTANNYIDKWVRESVVTAALLFITFCGHISFLLLTLPVFANKNFPYHVRTTQIGAMEAAAGGLDHFGHSAYEPRPPPVIIPLSRRTEELLGSVHHYMATAPPLHALQNTFNGPSPLQSSASNGTCISYISNNHPDSLQIQGNVGPKLSISTQHSAESVTIEHQKNLQEIRSDSLENRFIPPKNNELFQQAVGSPETNGGGNEAVKTLAKQNNCSVFTVEDAKNDSNIDLNGDSYNYKDDPAYIKDVSNPFLVGASFRASRRLLEPIVRKDAYGVPPPAWSLAKSVGKQAAAASAGKRRKEMINGMKKAENVDYHLQGVIGTFPLPQIRGNPERKTEILEDSNKMEERDDDKMAGDNKMVADDGKTADEKTARDDSSNDDRDSCNEESLHILQGPVRKLDETTMALFP